MNAPNEISTLQRLAREAVRMSTSLRVLGVLFVILALPYVAIGYGLLVAWAPAGLGILLWQAGTAARGEAPDMPRLMRKLRHFFLGFTAFMLFLLVVAFSLAVVPWSWTVRILEGMGIY